MKLHLVRNKRLSRYTNPRRRTVTNFFKFSPTLLRFQLLPRWVFVSLAVNGILLAILSALCLKYVGATTASSAAAQANPTETHSVGTNAQVSLIPLSPAFATLGTRHQLTYQQWQNLLAQEADVAAEQDADRLTILAGDSISLWFPQEFLPSDRTWLNQAISGETSIGLLKRLNLFDQTKPETIFVMIGINDLLHGVEDEELLDNQQQIIEDLKAVHAPAQIVLQSILPHAAEKATWEGRDRLLTLSNRRIQAINRELEEIAQEEGVYFLDLYSLFADAAGNLRMELSTDGLHLNPQGYYVWGIALQVYSREVLEPERVTVAE